MPSTDLQNQIAAALQDVFADVRGTAAARWGDNRYTGDVNPKGDRQLEADVEADQLAAEALAARFGNLLLLSEERAEPLAIPMGDGKIDCAGRRAVLDPIDGSRNHARGLPFPGFAIAILDPDGQLSHEAVEVAIAGSIFPHDLGPTSRTGVGCAVAIRGRGARALGSGQDLPLRVSRCTRLREAAVGVELHGSAPGAWFGPLCEGAWTVRAYGASVMTIASIALGRLDAHVDVAGRLTPENDLAAARIVLEAGGVVVGPDGGPVAPAADLNARRDAIFAATPELAEEILALVRG